MTALTAWIKLFNTTLGRIRLRYLRWPEILHQTYLIGNGSLAIVVFSTAFAGIVVSGEIAWHMNLALSTVEMIPGFTAQFIMRELAVAVPALLLVAKVGAAITAEVGTMRITDQLDALKLLGIDEIDYLVVPRFLGCIVASVCLTVISMAVTLFCAIGVAVLRYHFTFSEYMIALKHFVGFSDLICAIVKALVFGAAIPIISTSYGFQCRGGAEGVGNATTDAVVSSTIAVIFLDFVLTFAFTNL